MAREYLIRLMVRVIYPAGLLLSIGLRPFGLSIFYLLLFFISPNTHTPSSSGKSKIFLIFSLVLSSCLLIVHIAWHSVLLYYSPYPSLLETLPLMKTIGLNLGLVSFADVDPALAIYYLSPEIIMICVSTSVLFSVKKLTANAIPQSRKKAMYQHYPLLTDACSYVCLLLILISGILRPSALSGIYFLMFIGIATAWSLGRSLARSYEVVAKVLMIIMALHVIALLAYQWTMLNEMLTPDEQIPRILGLVKFISINPSTMSFQYVFVQNQQWSSLASPLVTLLAYYILSLISGEIYKPKVTNAKLVSDQQTSREPTETDPLVGGTIKASSSKSSMMRTTRLGSNRSETSSFARLSDDEVQIEENPTITDDIIAATVDFFQVLVRSSYIPTTITMMAWSIMFHSWLAFIFLMWANIVWLRQDQRSFMLKTSPILVIYAIFLLMAEYIDGMNLKEDELPSNITGINIQQIGLGRKNEEPFHNLLIKSLFTCMFWMTLKQLFTDIKQRKMESIVSSMGTTTPSTSGIATAKRRSTVCEERSRLFIAISKSVRMLCARYWIYVVVIMLFVIGINGQGMTIFRIIYMMLFIVFILVFQLNWYLWRRLMYGFWITVIMYSMVYLILLYVYQFDNFPSMIEQYLFIDQKLQHDLGLDTYKPADLFVKLLTPTLFLIITIMQVHYFHKDFLMLSESKLWTSTVSPNAESRRPSQMGSTMKDDIPPLPSEQLDAQTIRSEDSINATENVPYKRKLSNLKKKSPLESTITSQPSETLKQLVLRMYFRFINVGTSWVDTAFIVLELHITKIIFLAVMLLCVFNVCALHAPLMLMITPATMFSPRKARFVIMLMSILISVYFIVSMIYQIPYIRDDMFESKCEINTTNNVVFNNAEWLGLTKANDKGLASLLKGYIALIALFIINSLVTYRRRLSYRNERPDDERVQYVFPEVTRAEADLDLIHCFKYLANHCFYKFGVEITLICLLGAIGSRMDVYAVFYSIWLLIMVRLERAKQAKIWPLFYSNLLVFIPIQYFMALGIVPFLCTEYPWNEDSDLMKSVRSWFFLPDHLMPPHSTKIIFDFVLLMFVSCQYKVFNIESTFGESYHGGSNKMDVGDNWEKPGFVNPVPDFLNRIDTWLDVVKRVIFLGMMWVTLAIMFLTGTNRVNLFSIGYLIGSFIFLWQGTEFYLRPKDIILKWWRRLILYNVVVVMSKSLLQAVGCIYGSTLQAKSCWLVQLLAIGCIDKFSGGDFSHFIHMDLTKYRVSTNVRTKCQVPQEDIGLAWDGVCFAFLILQHRLFRSYYFYRIIDECKAATILASRGAELIEEIRQKQMASQEVHEKKILEKIKVKMEKIKANQKRVQGFLTKEPLHHDLDEDATEMSQQVPLVMDTESGSTTPKGFHTPISEHSPPPSPQFTTSLSAYLEPQLSEPKDEQEEPADHSLRLRRKPSHHSYQPRYKPPSSHQKAVLSGDYYMFDDFDDTELQLKEEESSSDDDEPIGMGIGKLLSTVLKTDLNRAIQMRRASAPLVRPSRKISITSGPMSYPHDIQTQRTRPPVVDVILPKKEEAGQYSDVEDYDSMIENETIVDKMKRWIEIAGSFISSLLSTLIRWLNKHSRDYRYISRILSAEKKLLMQKEGFGIGVRVGSQQIWTPQPENNILRVKSNRKLSSLSVPSIRIVAPSMERGLEQLSLADDDSIANQSMFSLQSVLSKTLSSLEDDSMFHRERSNLLHFFYSLWFVILAHTDVLCYIMVFINQVQSATILSIPLPLMVFLWGTLSVPRPSKTFWITLIAYTEIIVLVKSMFQFEILPWNQKEIPDHFPFAAPRIIGIERKPNYALYDLLLLLMIFLHRSILKSLGLWVESPVGSDEDLEVKYKLTTDDAKMIAEGNAEEVGLKYLRKHEKEFRYQTNIDENSEKIVKIKNITEAGTSRGPKKLNIEALSPNEDVETTITITTNLADVEDRCFFCLSLNRYCDPMRVFFKRMLSPGSRHTTDVYAYMFLCDFINFLVVIFGFAAFGTHQGDGGVKAYLEENKVPIPFLIMLILQFALIVIDRALYLRKFIMGKIMFQYALIIGVHVWMFFVLPFITERTFNALIPPPMWYMVKCIYLLLSAYQIRCGYPRRLIGNFLSKSYGFVNMILFRGFMAVPFVFELRTLMDWIWTDTSMTLADWLKMEDIFASVFLLKCSRHIENEYPQARGSKKSTVSKYLIGGSVLAFVIAIIWFPLVLFALGNTVGEANAPTDVTVKISIGPFLPIYQMSAQAHNIRRFTEQEFNQLSGAYPRDRTAQTFLSNYMYSDVVMVILNPNSTNTWAISPPEMNRLEQETASNSSLSIKLSYVITHPSNSAQNSPVIEASRVVALPDAKSVERDTLLTLLYGNASSDAWVNVNYLFPKFVKVFNKGEAVPAYQLMPEIPDQKQRPYRGVFIRLERENDELYWRVKENCSDGLMFSLSTDECDMLVMYTFNDRIFPETLNFISAGGIIGLYTTFVFLAARLLHGFFSGIYTKIMFDDLPNVDRVLQLCLDIYLVREALELSLEEDLFAKLVFLYRSPETMIKWSRLKEDDALALTEPESSVQQPR